MFDWVLNKPLLIENNKLKQRVGKAFYCQNFVSKMELQFQNIASILKLNFSFKIEVRFETGALILKSTGGNILKLEFHFEL